jgi:hypothetical protein
MLSFSGWVTKVKPDVNSVRIHPQTTSQLTNLFTGFHPMDGMLVVAVC